MGFRNSVRPAEYALGSEGSARNEHLRDWCGRQIGIAKSIAAAVSEVRHLRTRIFSCEVALLTFARIARIELGQKALDEPDKDLGP
jgi:hypothetical protein